MMRCEHVASTPLAVTGSAYEFVCVGCGERSIVSGMAVASAFRIRSEESMARLVQDGFPKIRSVMEEG